MSIKINKLHYTITLTHVIENCCYKYIEQFYYQIYKKNYSSLGERLS